MRATPADAGGARGVRTQPKRKFIPRETVALVSSGSIVFVELDHLDETLVGAVGLALEWVARHHPHLVKLGIEDDVGEVACRDRKQAHRVLRAVGERVHALATAWARDHIAARQLPLVLVAPERRRSFEHDEELFEAVVRMEVEAGRSGHQLVHRRVEFARARRLRERTAADAHLLALHVPGVVAEDVRRGHWSFRSWTNHRRSPVCDSVRACAVICLVSGYSTTSGVTRIPATT